MSAATTLRLGIVDQTIGPLFSPCGSWREHESLDIVRCKRPGLLLEAYKSLAETSERTIRFHFVPSRSYGHCHPLSNCTGLFALFQHKAIDATLSCVAREASRLSQADYSPSTLAAREVFVMRDEEGSAPRLVPGKAFLPFRWDVGLCLALALLAFAALEKAEGGEAWTAPAMAINMRLMRREAVGPALLTLLFSSTLLSHIAASLFKVHAARALPPPQPWATVPEMTQALLFGNYRLIMKSTSFLDFHSHWPELIRAVEKTGYEELLDTREIVGRLCDDASLVFAGYQTKVTDWQRSAACRLRFFRMRQHKYIYSANSPSMQGYAWRKGSDYPELRDALFCITEALFRDSNAFLIRRYMPFAQQVPTLSPPDTLKVSYAVSLGLEKLGRSASPLRSAGVILHRKV